MLADKKFHKFSPTDIEGVEFPQQFTFPFHYVPHRLCVVASEYVKQYVASRCDWHNELQNGKMLGVLVVKDNDKVGFLAAYSGNLAHNNNHEYFVPPVYDLLSSESFFTPEEAAISDINARIKAEENSQQRQSIISLIAAKEVESQCEINNYREYMQESKTKRDRLKPIADDINVARMIAESQFQKAELRRIRTRWNETIATLKYQLEESDKRIARWKEERKRRSRTLQMRIFRNFVMLNARGEQKDLCEIFADTPQGLPPAGAGECAAPKLLQYAYLNGYKPIAMAEFWIGRSPKDEIRHNGHFYPSCKSKCEPILNWSMQGLDVEPNPLEKTLDMTPLKVLFDDKWIVAVNKPEGVLSVPGKLSVNSLYDRVKQLYPNDEILTVHRLDMATSGIILFAKSKAVHKQLQSMFKTRQVKKQYEAILDGVLDNDSGEINMPITLNPDDRPRQMVSLSHGKTAITHYEVIGRTEGKTRIFLYPITGRTHQLRVHASHPNGLGAPIAGDTLYGTHAPRLYLHARQIEFPHPITHTPIIITSATPF